MGTDIHAAMEFRESELSPWQPISWPNRWKSSLKGQPDTTFDMQLDRDYSMFAILAGVRNGSGFAGCDLGDGFIPICEPRGVPDGISAEAREVLSNEHTPTWLSLRDFLEYDWTRKTNMRGVISVAEFEEWDRMKEWHPAPKTYCGDVMGRGTKHVSNAEMRAIVSRIIGKHGGSWIKAEDDLGSPDLKTYTRVEWSTSYSQECSQVWNRVLPKMLLLGKECGPDNVRIVMDFDS